MAVDETVNLPIEDGAKLLEDIRRFFDKYIVLTPEQADICALWTMHTHVLNAAEFTPYLHIFSPVLRSGKTLLLTALSLLVAKPWLTGRVTGAVLVRKTDGQQPTLLLDESDTAFQVESEYSEKLRGILNTGFERNGKYSVCVQRGNDWGARDFATFSPKAIAGIGRLPHTIEDRSIPITLKRKRRDEQCERFRSRQVRRHADPLKQRLCSWASQNVEALRDALPEMPDELNDRQQDVCEPLVAIADRIGGGWPIRARRALGVVYAGAPQPDDSSGSRILADIKQIFERRKATRVSTRSLLADLNADETAPWSESVKGRPLTPPQLARLLKPFGIFPRDIRFGDQTLKGYYQSDFEDSWKRYLPPADENTRQARHFNVDEDLSEISDARQELAIAAEETAS